MNNIHAKGQGQRSVGSKGKVETNGRTDRQTDRQTDRRTDGRTGGGDCITSCANAVGKN